MFRKFLIIFGWLIAGALKLSAQNAASSPLQFVENKGQWDPQVSYRASMRNGAFFLHRNGFSVLMQDENDLRKIHMTHHGMNGGASISTGGSAALPRPGAEHLVLHSHIYRVNFLNASGNPEIIPEKPIETYNNYFIGADPAKWAGHCRIFQAVTYKNIYPNIDLSYYAENGALKYNFVVHPGGNPDNIALHYDGVDQLQAKNKQLQIRTSLGVFKETIPLAYQLSATEKTDVECRYSLSGKNTVKFKISNYAPDATLVIDPTEIFCSFSGSAADNWGFTATYGPDGSMFIAGIVAGQGYQVTNGAFQIDFAGGGNSGPNSEPWDVGIMKFNSTGSTVDYATYLGGGFNDYPHSLVCDPAGELVVFGRTESGLSFPLQPAKNLIGPCGGRDIFVTKFNASGTALIGSMLVGGTGDDGVNIDDQDESGHIGLNSLVRNYGDWSRGEVILDGAGNIYVASCTQSPNDFPIRGAVFQPKFGGGNQDGVLLKINPSCNSMIFSSYLGGTHDDVAFVMDIDPLTNDIFVGGSTASPDFPGVLPGVLQPVKSDSIDGFVSRIANNGSSIIASTYLGTTGIDMIYGLKFDKYGFPYVMGTTTGAWTVTPNVSWSNAGSKQFVSKLDTNLSKIVYSTTFGSVNAARPNISPVAFLVDQCQNVYVSGWGGFYRESEPYFLQGTLGMPTTAAIPGLKTVTDNHDFYFIVIKRDASGLLFGNFFGQDDTQHADPSNWCCSEHVDGGTSRFDKQGTIYEAICANCVDHTVHFPTSAGARYRLNGAVTGAGCNEAALKIAFNFAGVSAGLKSLINGRPDTSGCITLDPTLEDTVLNARSYIWNFGDGSPDTPTIGAQVTHAYANTGTYLVRLIAIDSTSCNISDTAFIHIVARNDPATLAFVDLKLPPCQSLSYQFNNLSVAPAGMPFSNTTFIWDFGDGSPQVIAGTGSQTHNFPGPGTYKVKLILQDTTYCNNPDTLTKTLNVSPLVKAQFIAPATGCAPDSVVFTNTSSGGQQFFWSFGDGGTSNDPSPGHLYPNIGTYTVKLVVVDSNTCNIIDSSQTTISIYSKPHAGLSTMPVPPLANTPNVFTNLSTGGILYKWFFGDGDTAVKTTTDTVIHQYSSTGTFQACVVVYNQYQCTDTACIAVQTIVNPLLDVPNAFTPGRFGENAIVKVRGFGISKLVFRIYNRWGQKVFESNDVNIGWDGTYKGNPQPMDVYAYTVEAEYFDGTRVTKKGDITLIR